MICGTGLDLLLSSGRVSMLRLSYWSGQQQHLLQWLQALGAQEMQWAQALDKRPWLQMYKVPGNCTPLGWQITEGSPGRTWQTWGGSFLLLPRRCSQQQVAVNFQPQHVKTACKKFKDLQPVLSSRHLSFKTRGSVFSSCVRSAMLHASETWPLTKPNLQRLQRNDGQWSDRSAMSGRQTLPPPSPVSYLRGLALRIWISFWRREDSNGVERSNGAFIVLGFNDTSTLVGHFVSSPREREKRDRRDSRRDEREGQGRKRNWNESEETEEIKTSPPYPYLLQG